MKKKIIVAMTVAMSLIQSVPILANSTDSFVTNAYDVYVSEEYRVPYSNSTEGYFENGLVTGFGSAVTFKGYNANGEPEFYAVTDRGPNADAPKYNNNGIITESKIFPCPEFTPSIAVITVKDTGAEVTSVIELKDSEGNTISGLPLEPGMVGSTGETALDINMNNIGYDADGLDTEGIAVDSEGNFYLCDEYGPFIVKVAPDGTILEKYSPGNGLPEVISNRIANRGFEGLTITPSGKILASVQSVLDINGETSKTACFTRIVEFDPTTKETKMYAYPVDLSMYNSPKDCKIGDIYAIDDNTLLVIEQGKLKDKTMTNNIYKVDLSKATDITGMLYEGKELEYAPSADVLDINFIEKELYINLREKGWIAEKAEGICMTSDNKIVVINDNDFGIVTSTTDGEKTDVDITDYVYDSTSKTYTLNGEAANPVVSIKENTEPAQIWILSETENTDETSEEKYVMLRNAAYKLSNTENKFDLEFDNITKTVNIIKNKSYTETGIENATELTNIESLKSSDWTLKINGENSNVTLYNSNGYNYIKVSDIENIFGIDY